MGILLSKLGLVRPPLSLLASARSAASMTSLAKMDFGCRLFMARPQDAHSSVAEKRTVASNHWLPELAFFKLRHAGSVHETVCFPDRYQNFPGFFPSRLPEAGFGT